MEELKEIMNTCKDFFFAGVKAANSAKNEEDKKDDEAKNEDTDKRELIRQIAAIAGKEEDSEDVRTIIKLAEKLAYDKSEAGTADNKAKNEEDKEDKKEDEEKAENEDGKEEDKKDEDKAENSEDEEEKEDKEEKYEEFKEKIEKEAENKCKNKAKNSADATRIFYESNQVKTKAYMSQKDGIELGKKLY